LTDLLTEWFKSFLNHLSAVAARYQADLAFPEVGGSFYQISPAPVPFRENRGKQRLARETPS
jgi:hypothetical protein